ncbi:hypothetical protein QAD02_018883 [Eretmocerus hayati]|uniref:Uncharacterized protein n=1 Tax=Eretmocerus hayati TaxID=131215 RepID=A0ACC2PI16_9HYME|nr:hypothetical protein QAD02_018883 [Eretmocerus hayati]
MSEESKIVLEKWRASMIGKFGVGGFDLYQKELFEKRRLPLAAIVIDLVNQSIQVPDDSNKKPDNIFTRVFSLIENVLAKCPLGDLCLIYWKIFDQTKSFISANDDASVQVAAYIGALKEDLKYSLQVFKLIDV